MSFDDYNERRRQHDEQAAEWRRRTSQEISARRTQALDEIRATTREGHIAKAEELLAGTWRPDVYADRPPNWVPPTEYDIAVAQLHMMFAQVKAAEQGVAKPVALAKIHADLFGVDEEPVRDPWHAFLTRGWWPR